MPIESCSAKTPCGRVYPKNLVAFDFWQFRKVVMPARLRLSWGMKTWTLFLLSVLESLMVKKLVPVSALSNNSLRSARR